LLVDHRRAVRHHELLSLVSAALTGDVLDEVPAAYGRDVGAGPDGDLVVTGIVGVRRVRLICGDVLEFHLHARHGLAAIGDRSGDGRVRQQRLVQLSGFADRDRDQVGVRVAGGVVRVLGGGGEVPPKRHAIAPSREISQCVQASAVRGREGSAAVAVRVDLDVDRRRTVGVGDVTGDDAVGADLLIDGGRLAARHGDDVGLLEGRLLVAPLLVGAKVELHLVVAGPQPGDFERAGGVGARAAGPPVVRVVDGDEGVRDGVAAVGEVPGDRAGLLRERGRQCHGADSEDHGAGNCC